MINVKLAEVGMSVYQQNKYPDYGTIAKIDRTNGVAVVYVLFLGEARARPVDPKNLNWPPYFCAKDDGRKKQIYDYEWHSSLSDTIPTLRPEDLI